MPSLQDAVNITTLVTFTVTACAAVFWLWGVCIKAWKSFAVVAQIAAEFKPNGGGSTRDRLDKIQDTLDGMVTLNIVSMNLVPFPMLKADRLGQVYWVNRQFIHEAEVSENEVMGLGWLNLVSDDHRESVRSQWLSAIEDARSLNVEFDVVHGCTATLVALPLVSQKHGLIGMVGTLRFERTFTHG